MKEDTNLTFLNAITPRVGPGNAISLMRDSYVSAFMELILDLGITKDKADSVVKKHLEKTVQNVNLQVPVRSPFQVNR